MTSALVLMQYTAVVGGAIPMLVVSRVTRPFVSFVHVQLPFYARVSKESFAKFIAKIPPKTEIDLTTIKSFGVPRVQRLHLTDLRKAKYSRASVVNLEMTPLAIASLKRRRWWQGRRLVQYYVGDEKPPLRGPVVETPWQTIWKQIQSA